MEGIELSEKDKAPVKEKSKLLKGIESFKLETEEDIVMLEMIIPEPPLKKNSKPVILHPRKKDSIF